MVVTTYSRTCWNRRHHPQGMVLNTGSLAPGIRRRVNNNKKNWPLHHWVSLRELSWGAEALPRRWNRSHLCQNDEGLPQSLQSCQYFYENKLPERKIWQIGHVLYNLKKINNKDTWVGSEMTRPSTKSLVVSVLLREQIAGIVSSLLLKTSHKKACSFHWTSILSRCTFVQRNICR